MCASKIDLSKTYDRVEWGLLVVFMSKMGFSQDWINYTGASLRFHNLLLLIERSMVSLFLLEGLDKDPLSPYLFLLCTNGFVRLISRASCRELHAATIQLGGPPNIPLNFCK